MTSAPSSHTPPWRVHAAAEAERHIEAPAERVWALLCDVERWPQWHPAIAQARMDHELQPGSRFFWKSGGMAIESTVEQIVPAHRLVWSGRALGTRAWHTWVLEPKAGGVRVVTTECFGGWLPRALPGTLAAMLDRALPEWLAHLDRAARAPSSPDAPRPR